MTDVTHTAAPFSEARSTWHEIDPWGAAPQVASKLVGLGGTVPSPDPGFVFATGFITISPGPFRIRIIVEGLYRSEAAFLLEILNRSDVAGSPPVRLRLEIAPLGAIADAGGSYEVSIQAEPNTQYALACFLHSDPQLQVAALRTFISRQVPTPAAIDDQPPPAPPTLENRPVLVRTISQLGGSGRPSFTNPCSQSFTSSQRLEPAFHARCAELGLDPADRNAWPQAFVLQSLIRYGALAPGRRGIGFDCAREALPWRLLNYDARILITRFDRPDIETDLGAELAALRSEAADSQRDTAGGSFTTLVPQSLPAGYARMFDLAWWIAPPELAVQDLPTQMTTIVAALATRGIAILVLPFSSSSRDTSFREARETGLITRTIIERIALETIAEGNSVAQMRFGPPISTSAVSWFGLIVASQ